MNWHGHNIQYNLPYVSKFETKYVKVEYQLPDGLLITNDDVQRCVTKQRAPAEEFFKWFLDAELPVAVIGLTRSLLKVHSLAWAIKPNCVVFQFPAPTDTPVRNLEDALSRDFGILFRQPQHHLECELKNYLHHLYKDTRIPTSILDKLQLTKILSVKICDEEIFKEIGLVLGVPPPTPKNLTVKENPQSPSTSLVVFYEHAENTIVDEYIAAAQTLCGGEPPKEVETTEEYAVIQGLLPGQAYVVWVQAIRTGVRSEKALVRMPIRTAQFDPHPWRGLNPGLLAETDEIAGTSADESAARGEPEPPQWNSNLHRELKRILGLQFPDSKMRQLLIKCDELGVAGVNDLKYLGRKEITDDLNGTIKPVEILKLMDYARDKISE